MNNLLMNLTLDPATRVFFLAPICLILLDAILGIAQALKKKGFSMSWIADFAQSNLVPYAGILMTSLATPLVAGIPYLAAADGAKVVIGAFCLAQLASIFDNIGRLTGNTSLTNAIDGLINGLMAKLFPFVPSVAPANAPTASADVASPIPSTPSTKVIDSSSVTVASTPSSPIPSDLTPYNPTPSESTK